jgi:outer membrane protein assembly factor BamA
MHNLPIVFLQKGQDALVPTPLSHPFFLLLTYKLDSLYPYSSALYDCDCAYASVMREAVPTAKSSVAYRYTDDRRNDPIIPTAGSFFSVRSDKCMWG